MRMIILVLLLARLAPAADWRLGQLVDASSERVYAGASANGPFPSTSARYVTALSYVIRSGDREFVLAIRPAPGLLRPRLPHVVVNTAIHFRIEKGRATLLDDDGKEYKGQVEREAVIKPDPQ